MAWWRDHAPCFLSGPRRATLRAAYQLPPTNIGCCGEEVEDYLVHCLPCTVACAICQEALELNARGAAPHCPAVPRHGGHPTFVAAQPQAMMPKFPMAAAAQGYPGAY